jgi:hypothetical protein
MALSFESQLAGETNDCSVKAIALVTGVNYLTALDACRHLGRKPRRGMKTFDILAAVRMLGKAPIAVPAAEFIRRYGWKLGSEGGRSHRVTSHQPARFPKAWKDGNTYLLFTATHVLAVVDGVTHDWSVNKSLRVIAIYKIESQPVVDEHAAMVTPMNPAGSDFV